MPQDMQCGHGIETQDQGSIQHLQMTIQFSDAGFDSMTFISPIKNLLPGDVKSNTLCLVFEELSSCSLPV